MNLVLILKVLITVPQRHPFDAIVHTVVSQRGIAYDHIIRGQRGENGFLFEVASSQGFLTSSQEVIFLPWLTHWG